MMEVFFEKVMPFAKNPKGAPQESGDIYIYIYVYIVEPYTHTGSSYDKPKMYLGQTKKYADSKNCHLFDIAGRAVR